MTDLQTILANISPQVEEARKRELEAYQKAYKPSAGMSGPDALYAGLVGIAPLIAGAIKGGGALKKGADAGLLATELYKKDLDEKIKKRETLGVLEAELASNDRKTLEKRAQGLEDYQAKEGLQYENDRRLKQEFPNKGTTIANYIKTPPPADLNDKMGSAFTLSFEIDRALRFMEEKFAGQLQGGEGVLDVLARKGTGFLPETDQRELEGMLAGIKKAGLNSMEKGNPSAIENRDLWTAMGAGGLSGLRDNYKGLIRLRERSLEDAFIANTIASQYGTNTFGNDIETLGKKVGISYKRPSVLTPSSSQETAPTPAARVEAVIQEIESRYDTSTPEGRAGLLAELNSLTNGGGQ